MQSQNETGRAFQAEPYPKTLGEILDALPEPGSSASISSESRGSLSTRPNHKDGYGQIGKPLSETGLTTLRNFAQSVSRGNLLDDAKLETLLVQLLGSSRFASKPKHKHVYGADGQYDRETEGFEITLDALHDNEMKLYEALEYYNRPAHPHFVSKELGRVQAVMARRSESNEDLAVVNDTYTRHLEKYPPDVIAAVCRQIIEHQKWFPLISDMVRECEKLMRFRKAVWECFQIKRNPLLSPRRTARIEADSRLEEHWKSLPRDKWLDCHWDWYIADAEHMAKLSKEHGRDSQAEQWTIEAERRKGLRNPVRG